MAAEVPTIIVTENSSSKRRSDLRVSADTPGGHRSITKRPGSPLSSSSLCGGKEVLKESDDDGGLDGQERVISQLIGNGTKILSQIGSVSSVAGDPCSQQPYLLHDEQSVDSASIQVKTLHGECVGVQSSTDSAHDSTHLLLDLEKLTHKNAELCRTLAATRHSRTLLEREVLALKQRLHSERCEVTSNSAQSLTLMEENYRLLEENTKLKAQCSAKCHRLQEENSKVLQDNSKLKKQIEELRMCKKLELESCHQEIEQLRRSQLQEIDVRCQEVDTLKEQLTSQLQALQQESEELSQQVTDLSADRMALLGKVEILQAQLQKTASTSDKDRVQLEEDKCALEDRIGNLSQLVKELTAENSSLKSEIGCLEKECDSLRTSRETLGKTVEEKTSIVMSAIAELEVLRSCGIADKHQVDELKKELKDVRCQLRSQCDLSSELKLLVEQRGSRIQHLERLLCQRSNINGSLGDSATRQSPMTTKNLRHLLGSLSETQQVNQRLELELSQLRTSHAKLTGSYHAVTAIRDRMGQDNSHLLTRNKELDAKNKVLLGDKQFLLSKLEELSAECLHLANCEGAIKEELQKVCERRDVDMEELTQELEGLQLSNLQLQASANQVNHFKGELSLLEGVVDAEVDNLLQVTADYEHLVQQDKHQLADLTEKELVCAHGNDSRRADVKACEASVASIQGELEVLRARKTAVLLLTSSVVKISPVSDSSRASRSLNGTLCHHGNLKKKLKLLKKRNDFLRVRLGYTLAELQVYRRQKLFTDHQLMDMQERLDTLQKQCGRCTFHLDHMQKQV